MGASLLFLALVVVVIFNSESAYSFNLRNGDRCHKIKIFNKSVYKRISPTLISDDFVKYSLPNKDRYENRDEDWVLVYSHNLIFAPFTGFKNYQYGGVTGDANLFATLLDQWQGQGIDEKTSERLILFGETSGPQLS